MTRALHVSGFAVAFLLALSGAAVAAGSAVATGAAVAAGPAVTAGSGLAAAPAVAAGPAVAAAPAVSAGAAPAAEPRLVADPASIVASEDLMWSVELRLVNPAPSGLYVDSLTCEVEDLDAGETRADRTSWLSLPPLGEDGAVARADSTTISYTIPASAERARLVFRLRLHRADGGTWLKSAVVEAEPGPTSLRYPSSFVTAGGRRVEYVFVPARRDSARAPGVLLVHGHGNHARRMLRMAMMLAERGYAVMLASQPGYGLSQGPADFMGPATLRAMSAALDALKRSPGVDSTRLGVWGVSRGATVAAELAASRADLGAVVAQAGVYDLWSAYRAMPSREIRAAILEEAGSDSTAWGLRSPALSVATIRCPLLILHGEGDRNAPVGQARGFYEALHSRGVPVEARFFPGAEHQLPRAEVNRLAFEFLARQLKP